MSFFLHNSNTVLPTINEWGFTYALQQFMVTVLQQEPMLSNSHLTFPLGQAVMKAVAHSGHSHLVIYHSSQSPQLLLSPCSVPFHHFWFFKIPDGEKRTQEKEMLRHPPLFSSQPCFLSSHHSWIKTNDQYLQLYLRRLRCPRWSGTYKPRCGWCYKLSNAALCRSMASQYTDTLIQWGAHSKPCIILGCHTPRLSNIAFTPPPPHWPQILNAGEWRGYVFEGGWGGMPSPLLTKLPKCIPFVNLPSPLSIP